MSVISIIVPVYKVEKYLSRCIDSILSQTFKDFELILVNDGSPDNSGDICNKYAEKDSRVYVIHQENGGLSVARNVGIDWVFANSNSKWISFIDSDDWIHPHYLEAMLKGADENNTNVCVCDYLETESENVYTEKLEFSAKVWNTDKFFMYKNLNAIVAWGKLYLKEQFREIRYPVGKVHEDEFTTYKILFQNSQIAFIETPLYFYYVNRSSIMRKNFSLSRYDSVQAVEERILFFQERGKDKLVKMSQTDVDIKIALFSIMARKEKIYSEVPSKYKMGFFKAIRMLYLNLGIDKYEAIMIQYYLFLVKMQAYYRKLKNILKD